MDKDKIQKDVVNSIKKGESGRLILAPRVGKTKLIIDVIKRDKTKSILWVTPTSKLADEDIPSEFDKWKAKTYKKKLTTSTWKGLSKVEGNFDMIVLDEEQFMTENNVVNLLNGKLTANRILSMTGTETKHQAKKDLYTQLGLKILYRISINKAVDIGLLSNYLIKVVMVDLDVKKNLKVEYVDKTSKEKKVFYTSEWNSYSYLCAKLENNMTKFGVLHRLNFIKTSPSKTGAAKYIINSLPGKKLIFAANQKQAEELSDYVYHSDTDEKDLIRFVSGDINKIAMVNKGGTGYTYTNIDNLIVTQVDSDRNGLTSQKIARTLLEQGDYRATIWLLCLKGTKDEEWMASVLENFDENKIERIEFKELRL